MAVRRAEHNFPKLGSNHSNYFTRNRNKNTIPNHFLQLFWKAPKGAGIKFFDRVPKGLKEIENLNKN